MANKDAPQGFRTWGPVLRVSPWPLAAANSILRPGDVVELASDGTVDIHTAGNRLLGVTAQFKAASAGGTLMVYDHPMQKFVVQVQSGGNLQETNFGNLADALATASTATQTVSQMELSSTMATAQAGFRIVDLANFPGNAFGNHAEAIVMPYEHELSTEEPGTPGV